MKALTISKIKRFMKDELKGMKEYGEVGLDNLANDEAVHYKYLKGILDEGSFRGKRLK